MLGCYAKGAAIAWLFINYATLGSFWQQPQSSLLAHNLSIICTTDPSISMDKRKCAA